MRGSPFFGSVKQVEVALGDQSLRVPVFYYDGTAVTAMFPARYGALRALMPDPRFVPARLAPGIGAVTVTAFEYRDTDIAPYNELAISVPLIESHLLTNIPGRALASAVRRGQFHAWVHHLPVTTEIARAGGVEFYNYPKFIASIDFEERAGRRICRLGVGDQHILTLDAEKVPTRRPLRLQFFSHLWMDGQPQGSEFKINALDAGVAYRPGAASLTLGDLHPIARELASLLVSRSALYVQYLARFEGILYGPEHTTMPLIQRVQSAVETSIRV